MQGSTVRAGMSASGENHAVCELFFLSSRRRHTRYIGDWSSDVCSSDLLANGELEKLALYRPDGGATREDVAELVSEAVPGSTWAFLDAGARRPARLREE